MLSVIGQSEAAEITLDDVCDTARIFSQARFNGDGIVSAKSAEDPALAAVIGPKARPRSQVAKSLWDYIKKNKLQDAKNRRMINADANLKVVFGGRGQVSMFEMTKLVSKHLS